MLHLSKTDHPPLARVRQLCNFHTVITKGPRIRCIPPGDDVDCAGGGGNGPRFVTGPVRVTGNDPYGLDANHDGVGCE